MRKVPESLLVARLPDRDALLLVRPHGETLLPSLLLLLVKMLLLNWCGLVVVVVVRMIGWDTAGQMDDGTADRVLDRLELGDWTSCADT